MRVFTFNAFQFICIAIFFFVSSFCNIDKSFCQDTIRVNSVGLLPNSRVNAVPFLNKILERAAEKGTVILFDKGRYDFWPEYAIRRNYYESNTTIVNPRTCAMLISKTGNLTLDGNGSEFVFHGKMQPFTIDSSKNITIRNLSIDWDIPFGAEATIEEVSDDHFDLSVNGCQFPHLIENKKLVFVGEGWKEIWGGVKWNDPIQFDRLTHEVSLGTDDDLLGETWESNYTAEALVEDRVRIWLKNNSKLKKGNYLAFRIGVRDHAGVFMTDSRDISLENINMYSNSGMNFLAQFTENISYKNVNCIPSPSRQVLAGHDDGFHHSNCKGLIKVEGCSFRGIMDDAFNVHGTCVKIIDILSSTRLKCQFMHHQSLGFLWARAGEKVGFITRGNMQTVSTGRVKSVSVISPSLFEIEFLTPIPQVIAKEDALENLTWTPNVLITKSYFGHHRARGILVSTPGKVVIDNNIFETSGSPIVIPGDANHWFETGAVQDVTISNNLFKAASNTSMYQFTEAIISIYPEIPDIDLTIPAYHKNIRITGNTFEMFDYPVVYALNVDAISFTNNTIKRSVSYQPFHKRKHTLTFDACRSVVVKGNKIEKDVLGKNIQFVRTKPSQVKVEAGQGFSVQK